MEVVFYLLRQFALILIEVLDIAMLIRAVLSWFPIQRDHPILRFVCMVTEPLVAPIRALFDRMGWFRNFPIDLSFLVAFLLLSFVSGALGATL